MSGPNNEKNDAGLHHKAAYDAIVAANDHREEALKVAGRIGFPVMLRPSYVLGGRAMEIAFTEEDVKKYLDSAARVNPQSPVLIDKYLEDALEVDVDCICDAGIIVKLTSG